MNRTSKALLRGTLVAVILGAGGLVALTQAQTHAQATRQPSARSAASNANDNADDNTADQQQRDAREAMAHQLANELRSRLDGESQDDPNGADDPGRDERRRDERDARENGNERSGREWGERRGDRSDDGPGWHSRDDMGREFGEMMRRSNDPDTIDEALEFFKQYSPFRYGLYEVFADNAKDEQKVAVARLRQKMVLRYLRIEADTDRYGDEVRSLALRRLGAEDQIAANALAYKGADSDEEKEVARGKLRDAVKDLLEAGLKERELRIQRIRQRLDQGANAIEQERRELDDQADKEVEQILAGELPPTLQFDHPPRGPHPGGKDDHKGDRHDGPPDSHRRDKRD